MSPFIPVLALRGILWTEFAFAASSLTLEDFLGALAKRSHPRQFERPLSEATQESIHHHVRRFGHTETELAGRVDPANKSKSVSVFVNQPVLIWMDRESREQQARMHHQVDLANYYAAYVADQLEVGLVYLRLRKLKWLVTEMTAISDGAAPYFKGTARIQALGALNSLLAMKWKVLERKLKQRQDGATQSFAQVAAAVNAALGMEIPTESAHVEFGTMSPPKPGTVDLEKYPSVAELRAKEAGLLADARAKHTEVQVDVGLGVERHVEAQADSYLVRLSYPIGQQFSNRSEAREGFAQAEAARIARSQEELRLQRRLQVLDSDIAAGKANVASLESLYRDLFAILQSARTSAERGVVDGGAVLETVEQLLEIGSELAEERMKHEEALLESLLIRGARYE